MSVTFFRCESDQFDVNVSNSNARELLTRLGYDSPDLAGNMPAAELALRCDTRLAVLEVAPDPGHESYRVGNIIACGRPEGYVRDRLVSLRQLAHDAIAAGKDTVYYG